MKIFFVTLKFAHHGNHSGYDKLIDYFPEATVINGQPYERLLHFIQKQPGFIGKILNKLFGNKRHWIEWLILLRTPNSSDTIIHFLYPENQYRIFGKIKGKRKIIATFHQPPEFYDHYNYVNNYGFIDHGIVMSSNMITNLEKYVGINKLIFIPHGVDSDFFKPKKKYKQKVILSVGNWKRDYKFLRHVADELHKIDKEIKINIIANKEWAPLFKNSKNIEHTYGISDEELLANYHHASLMFLPLLDCTANNALLEGLSCGLPLAISNVGGVKDYLGENENLIFELTIKSTELAKQIISFMTNGEKVENISALNRQLGLTYSWDRIAKYTKDIYINLV